MAALPTSVRGHVSDAYSYGGDQYTALLWDVLEQVPELQPGQNAFAIYAQMAKDPTLAAILSSYTLQIRRASWALDGTGCRPEVVQQVADDLGLPIVGADKPGPARVRGVSWWDHLRAALLSLTYGHYGFELQAELIDGKARLVGLWDRAPWTVNLIHADPRTGAFLGVTQDGIATKNGKPQIAADRMAWYTHDQVGANHAGQSLLRPGYGVHMIKREVMRMTAIAHRRFSMGVPTVEWTPGSNPTQAQVNTASAAASAARVGETSGVALPPGAMLKLIGLSGGVPDNMALLKWLDSQLSRFALMPHIELGQNSAGGSRALGESFIDSWTLSLGSIGSEISDQATRQIVARLVEWNWGTDEPVPQIRVNGIGEQREVTAEALQILLSAGALDADPALKGWIRREWRLPEQEGDPEPVKAPGIDLGPDAGAEADPPVDDMTTEVAARQADLDWGLFGGPKTDATDQPSLFDEQDDDEDIDLAGFAPV